jgi:hypothetical protein
MQHRPPTATGRLLVGVVIAALVGSAVATTVYCPKGNGVSTQETISGGWRNVNATGRLSYARLVGSSAGQVGLSRGWKGIGATQLNPFTIIATLLRVRAIAAGRCTDFPSLNVHVACNTLLPARKALRQHTSTVQLMPAVKAAVTTSRTLLRHPISQQTIHELGGAALPLPPFYRDKPRYPSFFPLVVVSHRMPPV